MSQVKPKVGDYVRVVLEGKVTYAYDDGDLELDDLAVNVSTAPHIFKSVEVIDVVFPPGSVVQDKSTLEDTYLLTKDGFVTQGSWNYQPYDSAIPRGHFHSGNYELVKGR